MSLVRELGGLVDEKDEIREDARDGENDDDLLVGGGEDFSEELDRCFRFPLVLLTCFPWFAVSVVDGDLIWVFGDVEGERKWRRTAVEDRERLLEGSERDGGSDVSGAHGCREFGTGSRSGSWGLEEDEDRGGEGVRGEAGGRGFETVEVFELGLEDGKSLGKSIESERREVGISEGSDRRVERSLDGASGDSFDDETADPL
ncbi:hypothetical protein BDY24DRAFT_380004 [Mrakia frigida]|uniref:uncharacterized protein n=1 Tax=Mrakia frigida TaxID=29902 RepID=UPI003FCC1942